MMKDEITCFMLYYGRKAMAEESMESFLRQTYPHKKLIIINDHPDPVWFEREYPNVAVYNITPNTFETLNEKYKFALEQVKTKWWAPWDSDDIWLPWHLENLAAHIPKTTDNSHPRKIGISRTYFMLFKQQVIKIGWQMWSSAIWETFDKNGDLYAKCNPNNIENCDRQVVFQDWDRYWLDRRGKEAKKKAPLSFIFRWCISENHNRSAVLGEKGIEREKTLQNNLSKVKIVEAWHPQWRTDYIEKVKGEHEGFTGL